ncbi:hypothetical protein T09_2947 [Trichinella sp. T9]|nr:hypothetical protein T09_2947 [Trichinella sp. T9]
MIVKDNCKRVDRHHQWWEILPRPVVTGLLNHMKGRDKNKKRQINR